MIGVMEHWKDGMMGLKLQPEPDYILLNIPVFHLSIIPRFS